MEEYISNFRRANFLSITLLHVATTFSTITDKQFTIMVTIFRDFLMIDQTFLSPQAKRSVIISNIHGTYELPQELPNDLRLSILGN